MTNFIIVLGAPNDDQGRLLPVAQSRCDAAFAEYDRDPTQKILCTGGFGPGFNRTTTPHHDYTNHCLINKGVLAAAIVACVPSRFTIEDATLSQQALRALAEPVDPITVVTSDFHLPRVRMIFTHVFADVPLTFIGAHVDMEPDEVARLTAHEAAAFERDQNNLMIRY